MPEAINLKIVIILTFGFACASLFGYITHRMKLSPLLGYLFAGYIIGPYSPGYTADMELSEQLAEIGVILMMFSVGLHFRWQDLLKTSRIAVPGAIIQTAVSSILGAGLIYYIGWSLEAGIIFGLAIGVASTVVLVRVLNDNNLINTTRGHISVGWLIVEDMITVLILLLIPTLAVVSSRGDEFPLQEVLVTFSYVLFKLIVLLALLFTVGKKLLSYLFAKIIETKTHELFTLTILAFTFVIAAGCAMLLGTSIALGAFIAGMVIGETGMRQKVALNTTPLKDTFVVIFFLSIGMLFDPVTVWANFSLFLCVLAIILILKPLTAFLFTLACKYPFKTCFTVSLALAQIGEFSFILAEEAARFKLLPDMGYDIIVACALVSIAINPLLFQFFKKQLGVDEVTQ